MPEEAALPTIESLVGLGEGELIAAAPEAAAATTAATAAPALTESVAPATAAIPVSAELSASGVPLSQGAQTVQGVQDYLSTAPVSSANALPTAAETSEAIASEPTAAETSEGIASEQASEMSQEEFAKKMAENEAASAGTAATTEAPNAVDKALRYLGVTSANGIGPTAVPLAALGISQYRANKQAQAIKDQLAAASAQTKGVATSLLDKYQTGTIDANQQKQIDDLTNNTKARIKQRYAQMGRDPNTDSAAQSELAKADADAVAMRDTAQQGILTQGLNAAGLAQGPATSAVMAGYQNDLQQQQAMQNFMNTLALMQSKTATS